MNGMEYEGWNVLKYDGQNECFGVSVLRAVLRDLLLIFIKMCKALT